MKNDRPDQLPKARTSELIVKELPDETLVYDLANDKAHCLNHTAALVWKNCNGTRSIAEINASLAAEAGTPVDEGVVWLALDQLEKFNLLERVPLRPVGFAGVSRRQMIRTAGIAAIALPIVVSIVAPTPAMAATCVPTGAVPGGCNASTNCCSGVGNCKNSSQCN